MLTQAKLKELLHYNPETGIFTRLTNRGRLGKVGAKVGTKTKKGYLRIKINNIDYLAHRLAWFYIHGEWPKNLIDHINEIKDDNRILNLRDVRNYINQHNISSPKNNNKSGCIGVHEIKNGNSKNKYRSEIKINGERIYLGLFDTIESASKEYKKHKYLLLNTSTDISV